MSSLYRILVIASKTSPNETEAAQQFWQKNYNSRDLIFTWKDEINIGTVSYWNSVRVRWCDRDLGKCMLLQLSFRCPGNTELQKPLMKWKLRQEGNLSLMTCINTRKQWSERLIKRIILNIPYDFGDNHSKDKRNSSPEIFWMRGSLHRLWSNAWIALGNSLPTHIAPAQFCVPHSASWSQWWLVWQGTQFQPTSPLETRLCH